ncbi:MAG TPA: ABC transporter permease, partial [Myxococcaceae bacterium]|nr:ABC transporter permease [Myxococcaceae bacterium]
MASDNAQASENTSPASPREPPLLVRSIENLGRSAIALVSEFGNLTLLGFDVARWSVRRPYRPHNLFAQLDFVGVGSIFIVLLTGLFTGMVFAHQSSRAFELFDAESMVGPTVALTITRELAPVFSA